MTMIALSSRQPVQTAFIIRLVPLKNSQINNVIGKYVVNYYYYQSPIASQTARISFVYDFQLQMAHKLIPFDNRKEIPLNGRPNCEERKLLFLFSVKIPTYVFYQTPSYSVEGRSALPTEFECQII